MKLQSTDFDALARPESDFDDSDWTLIRRPISSALIAAILGRAAAAWYCRDCWPPTDPVAVAGENDSESR